jgi:hypothetical protein
MSPVLLNRGEIVAFDDSTSPHGAKVLGFLRGNLRGALEEMDLSPYRQTQFVAPPRAQAQKRVADRVPPSGRHRAGVGRSLCKTAEGLSLQR